MSVLGEEGAERVRLLLEEGRFAEHDIPWRMGPPETAEDDLAGGWERCLNNRHARNRKKTAATHYLEPPSNRIRSRNDNAVKPNQLSWLFINLSLQWPIVDG
jgi:hypothetical protein